MAVKAKVSLFPRATKTLLDSQKKAVGMTAEQMRTEVITLQTMPFQTGDLQNVYSFIDTNEIKKGQVKIVHDTPYARRLYYHPEYNFDHTFNASAGGLWWEPWLTGEKKERPMKLYKHFYRKTTGGYVK